MKIQIEIYFTAQNENGKTFARDNIPFLLECEATVAMAQ